MNDALFVGFVEGLGDLDGGAESLIKRQRTFLDLLRQRRPIDVGHRDERLVVFLVDAEDLADIGVIEGRRGLRFSHQPGF